MAVISEDSLRLMVKVLDLDNFPWEMYRPTLREHDGVVVMVVVVGGGRASFTHLPKPEATVWRPDWADYRLGPVYSVTVTTNTTQNVTLVNNTIGRT